MPMPTWLRMPRIRRSIALASIVLSVSGLYLLHAEAARPATGVGTALSSTQVSFAGPGGHGTFSTSQSSVLSGSGTLFAQLDLEADREARGLERAPLSLAVVLDTSGSMSGEKLSEAKRSVERLVQGMRDDDEILLVRYSDRSEIVQPLARVGQVRLALLERVRQLEASGGTNIPGGLSESERLLSSASSGRVRRIVLVSDGLDSSRSRAEDLARESFARGMTVSTLGIGLDFDESYMGSLAQVGHGNFAFVRDSSTLTAFLERELVEAASTTLEKGKLRVKLPRGVTLVRVAGAEGREVDGAVEVDVGSVAAGDRRRIVLELRAHLEVGERVPLDAEVSWNRVGGSPVKLAVVGLALHATDDMAAIDRSRDGTIFAGATSAFASVRQLEAALAYTSGDVKRAEALTEENEKALDLAARIAPAAAAAPLQKQRAAYGEARRDFATVAPRSAAGNAAAKSVFAKELDNTRKNAF